MKYQNHCNTMTKWLLWTPLKFAIAAFAFMMLFMLVYVVGASATGTTALTPNGMLAAMLGAIVAAAAVCISGMSRCNLTRNDFIALNSAQILLYGILFFTTSVLVSANMNIIMSWMMPDRAPASAPAIIALAILYLYLAGILLTAAYATYRRARAINIAPWRIICTIPFGLPMLWIAGYVLPEKMESTSGIIIKSKWIRAFTTHISSTTINATAMCIVLTAVCGLCIGWNAALWIALLGILFGIWWRVRGTDKIRTDVRGKYAIIAIIINIAVIVTLLFINTDKNYVTTTAPDVQITITDTENKQ